MTRRRARSLLLAALAGLGLMAPAAAMTPPAGAVVFAGLDCGLDGEMHAVGYPPQYSLNAVATAGPYAVPGTHATLGCELRRDGSGGPVVATWAVSSPDGVVPAMVPEPLSLSIFTGAVVESLWVCSTLTWTDVNGSQVGSGCEFAGNFRVSDDNPNDDPWIHVQDVIKPQDADL